MVKNFVIKKGENSKLDSSLIMSLFFVVLYLHKQTHIGVFLMMFFVIPIILYMIMFLRWVISFAIFLDIENQEIILNHSLFFRKKKISLKDIKEVDTLNGNIILFSSTPLSRWQKMVCKTKISNDYTVRLEVINAYEKIQLMNLLSDILPYSNDEK